MYNGVYTIFAQPEECASALCKVFASPELEVESLLGLLDVCLQRLAEFKDLLVGKEGQEGASHTDAWSWTICIRFIFGFAYGDGLALPVSPCWSLLTNGCLDLTCQIPYRSSARLCAAK